MVSQRVLCVQSCHVIRLNIQTTLVIPRTPERLNLTWLVPLPFRYTTKQCDKKESRHCDWEMSSEISKESSIDTHTYLAAGPVETYWESGVDLCPHPHLLLLPYSNQGWVEGGGADYTHHSILNLT